MQPDELAQWKDNIRENAACVAYMLALKAADRANPTQMPKADGLLQHAESVLRRELESMGLGAENFGQVLAMLRVEARS